MEKYWDQPKHLITRPTRHPRCAYAQNPLFRPPAAYLLQALNYDLYQDGDYFHYFMSFDSQSTHYYSTGDCELEVG